MLRSLFWVVLFAAALPLAAEVRLASGGKTDHAVVLPEKPTPDEKAAAADLCKYLTRITGAEFRVGGDAPRKIYVGKRAPGDKKPLAAFERRVRVENGDVYLYGSGLKGNAFAVYDFLEKFFDCRWYTFFGDECIPEKREAVFADLTLDVIPSFDFFCYNGHGVLRRSEAGDGFRRRARIYDYRPGGEMAVDVLTEGHTFSYLFPPGVGSDFPPPFEYFRDKAYFKTHPEYFSMTKSGSRTPGWQLCFSNPELRKELIRNFEIVAKARYKGGPARMSLGLNDKGHWGDKICWCPECGKLNEKYGTPAGSYWDFALELCRHFRKKYPEIRFQTSAYCQTLYPPARGMERTPDNLIISMAPLDETNFIRSYDETPGVLANLRTWSRVARGRFGIQLYPTVYPRPLWTHPLVANIDRLVRNVRTAHRFGLIEFRAEFGCGADGDMGFNELRMYLLSCLARDVNADVEALKKDFMEHYYGAAAPMMTKYLDELEKLEHAETNVLRWYPDHRSALRYLTPANLLRWQRDFDTMEELTKDDAKANLHVRRARTNLDEATMSVWYKFRDGEMPDRDMMKRRYLKTLRDSYTDCLATYEPAREREGYVKNWSKWRYRSMYYHYALAGKWRPLPEKFAKLPKGRVLRTVPYINRGVLDEVADTATGLAVKGSFPPNPSTDIFDVWMRRWDGLKEFRYKLPPQLSISGLKRTDGKHDYYYAGTTRLYPDCQLEINGIRGGCGVAIGYLYDPADPLRQYDVYLSLRVEGGTIWFDEAVLVKTDKPATKK